MLYFSRVLEFSVIYAIMKIKLNLFLNKGLQVPQTQMCLNPAIMIKINSLENSQYFFHQPKINIEIL